MKMFQMTSTRLRAVRILAVVSVVLMHLSRGVAAAADEFVKIEGQVRENIPAGPFLAGAYAFIWIAVLVYVVIIARGMARAEGEIAELRKRIDGLR